MTEHDAMMHKRENHHHPMGPALIPIEKALQLAGQLEGQEIMRKMRVGK